MMAAIMEKAIPAWYSTVKTYRSEVGLTLHLHHLHHHPQISSCLETPAPSFILNTVCHFSTTRSWPTRPTTQQVEHHPGRSQGVRLCFDRGSTVIRFPLGQWGSGPTGEQQQSTGESGWTLSPDYFTCINIIHPAAAAHQISSRSWGFTRVSDLVLFFFFYFWTWWEKLTVLGFPVDTAAHVWARTNIFL